MLAGREKKYCSKSYSPHLKNVCQFQGSFVDSEDRNDSAAAVSDFDMTTLKVSKSSVYVTASLPPYGVVRTPMHLRYSLTNRTDKVQEFAIVLHPSDAFMFSGNKQHNLKVLEIVWPVFFLAL